MASSTSSSEASLAGRALASALAREVAPTVLGFGVLVALASAWFAFERPAPAATVDDTIVAAQLEHARVAPKSELVIIGDSSALMGVDAERLPGDAQNLSLLAWAGPTAWGAVLDEYQRRVGPPSTVVVAVNHSAMAMTDASYRAAVTEALVVEHRRPWPVRPWLAAKDLPFEVVVAPVMHFPLPGSYGRMYGFSDDLSGALLAQRGGLVDPNALKRQGLKPGCDVRPTDAFLGRARRLGEQLRALKVRVALVLTPVPATVANAECVSQLEAARQTLAAALGLSPSDVAPTPLVQPDDDFATVTHLNANGRRSLTAALGAWLSPR